VDERMDQRGSEGMTGWRNPSIGRQDIQIWRGSHCGVWSVSLQDLSLQTWAEPPSFLPRELPTSPDPFTAGMSELG
jgi:hypothetical protein